MATFTKGQGRTHKTREGTCTVGNGWHNAESYLPWASGIVHLPTRPSSARASGMIKILITRASVVLAGERGG
jgi:hypothetical protein